jgi:hypothetical protein
MTIPTTSKNVRLDELHPRFKDRLEAFFNDPEIKGKVSVVSGVRTYWQQKYLYDGYKSKKPGFNLAANPDRKKSNGFQGSYHMAQPSFGSYGYAVDFRIIKWGGGMSTNKVNAVAKKYGIQKTVPSEWWHHQPGYVSGGKFVWFDAPALSGEKKITKAVAEPENAVAKYIKDCSKVVLRKGAKGKVVELLQKLLVAQGYKLTWHKTRSGIDGDFGRMTDRAVKRFQKDEGLVADGIVGKNTWAALTD